MEREGLERGHDAMNHSRVGGSLNNISHTHTHTHTSTNMCTLTVSHTCTGGNLTLSTSVGEL